jgi:hypothetical protein
MRTVSPRINDRPAAESLMLTLGKALHLACEFERKCKYVLRVLNIAEMYATTGDAEAPFAAAKDAKDAKLSRTREGMDKTSRETLDEIGLLTGPAPRAIT